jgi:hypothetical protein
VNEDLTWKRSLVATRRGARGARRLRCHLIGLPQTSPFEAEKRPPRLFPRRPSVPGDAAPPWPSSSPQERVLRARMIGSPRMRIAAPAQRMSSLILKLLFATLAASSHIAGTSALSRGDHGRSRQTARVFRRESVAHEKRSGSEESKCRLRRDHPRHSKFFRKIGLSAISTRPRENRHQTAGTSLTFPVRRAASSGPKIAWNSVKRQAP